MVKIPDSVTVNTGEQEEAYRNINKFFVELVSEIEKKIEKGPSRFKLDVVNLREPYPNPAPSDDMCHILYHKEKIVAAVFETRTQQNYIHFDYFLDKQFL